MRRFINRYQYIIILLLIIIVGCISILSYNQNKKIKGYEVAFGDPLRDTIYQLNIGLNKETENIFKHVIDNKYISRKDACILVNGFYQTSGASQDLFYMAHPISGFNESLNNQTSTISQDFAEYIRKVILKQTSFTYSLDDASILIKLTDNEVLKFEKMQEVNDYWMKILKNNIQGERPIILVKDKTWINLAKDFSDYANTLEWHIGKIYE